MRHWQEATIHVNGVDIHYWRTGTGKPAVLCAHGLTDSGRCWSLLAKQFEGEYNLIMPDARGHGCSTAPTHGYRTQDRVADALALLDALEIKQVYAIGHSMGGDSTAMLAAQAPDRLIAAVLEDPSFRPNQNVFAPAHADQWEAGLRVEQAMTLEQLIEHGRLTNPSWDERVIEPWAEAKLQVNPRVYNWLREPITPWAEYVAKIQVPTLVITGEPARGAIITPEIASTLTSLSAHIAVQRVSGAGHCVRYAQPEAFADAVQAFLAEHQ